MLRLTPLRAAALAFTLSFAGVATKTATLPPAPAHTAASFDVGILHVDKYGSGPQSLILIPGLGSGPWSWYGTIAKLESAYTIYVLTLPGFNGRPPTQKTPLFASFCDDFWTMLETQRIERPVVIGHSLGGTLGFALAERHPERLRAVVSVDGLPVFPAVASMNPEQRAAAAQRFAAQYASLSPDQTFAYEARYMSTIGTRNPELVEPLAKLESTSDNGAVAAWLKEDLQTDLRPQLSRIDIPVLLIAPYDPESAKLAGGFTQEQGAAFYRSLVPGANTLRVETIAPARHFAMLDQPDEFYAQLTQFLASLR